MFKITQSAILSLVCSFLLVGCTSDNVTPVKKTVNTVAEDVEQKAQSDAESDISIQVENARRLAHAYGMGNLPMAAFGVTRDMLRVGGLLVRQTDGIRYQQSGNRLHIQVVVKNDGFAFRGLKVKLRGSVFTNGTLAAPAYAQANAINSDAVPLIENAGDLEATMPDIVCQQNANLAVIVDAPIEKAGRGILEIDVAPLNKPKAAATYSAPCATNMWWQITPSTAFLLIASLMALLAGTLAWIIATAMKVRRQEFRITFAAVSTVTVAVLSSFAMPAIGTSCGFIFTPSRPDFLWRISDGKHSCYLLGTIHILAPGFYPLPISMEQAFSNSNLLVTEIDERQINNSTMFSALRDKGLLAADDTIRNHIWAHTSAELDTYLCANPKQRLIISRMRPWLASLLLSNPDAENLGYNPALGLDRHFETEAKFAGKSTDQVESMELQLKMLSGFDEKLQDLQLRAGLQAVNKGGGDASAGFNKLVADWQAGDERALEKDTLLDAQYPDQAELKEWFEQVLYKRNEGMVKRTEEFMSDSNKQCFVAVGAAHLIGKHGLLQLFRDRGYKVEQVIDPGSIELKLPEP